MTTAGPTGRMAPFADGSISLGAYVHELEPSAMIDTLLAEAVLADVNGFDGVTVAEHHAGYPMYVPNPILAASWLLEAMPSAWSAPNPVLLPLRSAGLVLEDLAWLATRHTGRVGASFSSGYVEDDFVACGVPYVGRHERFRNGLHEIAREMGAPGGVFSADPVVRAAAEAGVPLLVGAKGPRAIRLAAASGMGVIVAATEPAPLAEIHDAYIAAGGRGPRVMIRWVWLGGLPDDALRRWNEQHRHSIDSGELRQDTKPLMEVTTGDADAIAERLAADLVASRSTALSLRVHLPGVGPAPTADQIRALGTDMLPRLRSLLASDQRGDA
jgi:alkanesulfonate monooxygenase SsuD/methylene tetrahydromethanopterin reductase-like flavin-dependent oxidoreductase (luciferase family)